MGTRHLILAVIDGEYKLAQYGQWDGYPDGQGMKVVDFLKNADLDAFKDGLRKTIFLDESVSRSDEEWEKLYIDNPQFSRDNGARILQMICDIPSLLLRNNIEFAGDSLFCEFAYLIDMDNNILEIYTGFNYSPLTSSDRFNFLPSKRGQSGTYYPIKIVGAYSFDDLPTKEDMEADCAGEVSLTSILKQTEARVIKDASN